MKFFRTYLSLCTLEIPPYFCLNTLFVAAFTRGRHFNISVTGTCPHIFKNKFNIILRSILQPLWRSIHLDFILKLSTGFSSFHA